MALNELIYGKISNFFRKQKKISIEGSSYVVKLEEIKPRLTIFARAITGKPIAIYTAEREGGYKNNNFFLPEIYSSLADYNKNLSFYLFRVLYLSVQKNLDVNWKTGIDHPVEESRNNALKTSEEVFPVLYLIF